MAGYEDGFSPLTLAVKEGYVDAVKDLVGLGADVNGPDGSSFTPIVRAVQENHVDVIRTLVALGADLNTTNNDGTLLQLSVVMVLALLGANLNTPHHNGATPACVVMRLQSEYWLSLELTSTHLMMMVLLLHMKPHIVIILK